MLRQPRIWKIRLPEPQTKPDVPDISGTGNFVDVVKLQLPAFHNVAPKLALRYDSSRKTKRSGVYQAWLGYGWGFDGFHIIERVSKGNGVPRFDSTDHFQFDGNDVIACPSTTASASCRAGGTHTALNEDFRRYVYSSTADQWIVTETDGTKLVFIQRQREGKWVLQSATDTNGNAANYVYTCPDSGNCYPLRITYGLTRLDFYLEDRPDVIRMASGDRLMANIKRIKSIVVQNNSVVLGAYRLQYNQAPISNASRLVYIRRYGSNVTLDAEGTITGGSSKLMRTLAYVAPVSSYTNKTGLTISPYAHTHDYLIGDLNLDGRDEFYGDVIKSFTADVSHDGTTYSTTKGWMVRGFTTAGTPLAPVYLSTTTAAVNPVQWVSPKTYGYPGLFNTGSYTQQVGTITVVRNSRTSSDGTVYSYTSTPSRVTVSNSLALTAGSCSTNPTSTDVCSELPPASSSNWSNTLRAIDDNGDARTDLVTFAVSAQFVGIVDRFGDGAQSYLVATGEDTSTLYTKVGSSWATTSIPLACLDQTCITADFNGDGLTDIMRSRNSGKKILYSTGPGFVEVSTSQSLSGTAVAADFDNNGTADLLTGSLSPSDRFGTLTVNSVRYDSATTAVVSETSFTCSGSTMSGDFNGDGLPDFVASADSVSMSNATQSGFNLISAITYDTGGTVAVSYQPSTVWSNTFLPYVMHTVASLTVNDGRGTSGVTTYSYRGGLYNAPARKFLGYQKVTATKQKIAGETTAPIVVTNYLQNLWDYGLVDQTVEQLDTTHSKRVDESYTVKTSAPYSALNTSTVTTRTEGSSVATLQVDRTFSSYGTLKTVKDYGRNDVVGDEVLITYGSTPNLTDYIVSLLSSKTVWPGLDTTGPALSYEKFVYDGEAFGDAPDIGNLTTYIQTQSGSADALWTYTYDGSGNKLTETSEFGNTYGWDYDVGHRIIAEYFPPFYRGDTRFKKITTHNPTCGLRATTTDFNNLTETWIYDTYCRVKAHTIAGTGEVVRTVYEAEGVPTTQAVVTYRTPATGTTEVYERTFYDGLGRPWKVASSGDDGTAERLTQTAYDARGNVWKTTAPYYSTGTPVWTVNAYDWADRLIKVTNPDSTFKSIAHGLYLTSLSTQIAAVCSSDVPLSYSTTTDEIGNASREFSNTHDQLIYSFKTLGTDRLLRTCYDHDGLDRITRIADNNGSIWTYTYDRAGNRLTAQDPDLGSWNYGYDDENKLISQTDARGYVTSVTYDSMGRIMSRNITSPAGLVTTVADNTYDSNQDPDGHVVGLLVKAENDDVRIDYNNRFTGSGAITQTDVTIGDKIHGTRTVMAPGGQILYMSYTEAPLLDIGSDTQRWAYTTSNRLYSIPGYINAITYEANGNTRRIDYANGVTATFSYSPTRDWLTGLTVTKSTGAILDVTYTRYADGRIKTITNNLNPSDVWTYTYDFAGQLTKASNPTQPSLTEDYGYSGNGNLLSRTRVAGSYTYPVASAAHPHSPDTIGSRALSYDANGNMIGDGQRTLTWDAANRLASVALAGTTVNLAYAPDGARVKKTSTAGANTLYPDASVEINLAAPGGAEIIRYPYPDLKIVQKLATGAVQKQYLHRDHLSSVRAVTDDAGNIVEQTGYSAYGEATNASMTTAKNYIGERLDSETGLMYLNARYYDPMFGRFVPADPEAQN